MSNASANIDMATALDLPLGAENEAKFLALRNLHLKKIKQLMSSIDAKDKEIAKLKVLSKDNRRTQMIQALRNKIRDLEMVNDVMKEEMTKRTDKTLDEVNQFIMEKTIGGPKRFRPLTREELEHKIFELEKKLKRYETTIAKTPTANTTNQQTNNQTTFNTTSDMNSDEKPTANNNSSEVSNYFNLAIANDKLLTANAIIQAKETEINQLQSEIISLKSRNCELIQYEEQIAFYENEFVNLTNLNEMLQEKLNEKTIEISNLNEQLTTFTLTQSISEKNNSNEVSLLQSQCEKLLQQNSILLENLTKNENFLNSIENEINQNKLKSGDLNTINNENNLKIKILQEKLIKFEEKNKLLENKIMNLENENKTIENFKNLLRDKNIEIKELKRNYEEKEKILLLKIQNGNLSETTRSGDELKIVSPTTMERMRQNAKEKNTSSGGSGEILVAGSKNSHPTNNSSGEKDSSGSGGSVVRASRSGLSVGDKDEK